MRIVIDLQGAQSTSSRNRGIGRYSLSLALAMVRHRGDHEIILALNDLFPDTIEPIRTAFEGLLPQKNIRLWHAVAPVSSMDPHNSWRRQSAELVRETFLATLRPDIVHVTSLFEGFEDDAVTSIGRLPIQFPIAVTLYDLIPFIHHQPYLENEDIRKWYLEKIAFLKQADLLLAISESSRQESIAHLGLPDERTVNISTDANACFRPVALSAEAERALREKYGLSRHFVMYTGGIDHRKNIEGLIRSFSKLPQTLRTAHQLAIVCSVQQESRHSLEQLALRQGLAKDELVLTGFVPEKDLIALYNICALFVFPSWHEGFGLPVLEAMRCGAPTLCSNTSSLPEVMELQEAMFDPHSDESIAQTTQRALSDDMFRSQLAEHGTLQATKFSWDESARRAITAMTGLVTQRRQESRSRLTTNQRPRLAYISPLPPERSGIAEYSAELLPELARYYDIDVVTQQTSLAHPWIEEHCPIRSVQWFEEHAAEFKRVLYHIGNSGFHQHMFGLLQSIPGVVVLHDFYLSGVLQQMEALGSIPGCWTRELYESHGYAALGDRFHAKDMTKVFWKYPCNLKVIQNSLGIITHSATALRLTQDWYGEGLEDWEIVPHLRASHIQADDGQVRKTLGFEAEDFVVCAFGVLGPIKCNHRLVEAWLHSRLGSDKHCHLVFVGENAKDDYGQRLLAMIRHGKNHNIHITGWVDNDRFRSYLTIADMAVQLRTMSRGETSGTVLDCMNHEVPTIVNANGTMAELDANAVWMLADDFSTEELTNALETLWQDANRRQVMGKLARQIILEQHSPQHCARQYCEAIEHYYRGGRALKRRLPAAVARLTGISPGKNALIPLAQAIAGTFPRECGQKQLLVDISALIPPDRQTDSQHGTPERLRELLENPPPGYRIEPVYATDSQMYRYARKFTLRLIGCPDDLLEDESIEYRAGDLFYVLDGQPELIPNLNPFYQAMRRRGVRVLLSPDEGGCLQRPLHFRTGVTENFHSWVETIIAGARGEEYLQQI